MHISHRGPFPMLALAIVLAACGPESGGEPAVRILRGGPILTMDGPGATAEAVAIAGSRIAGVGRFAELADRFPGHASVDLEGAALMPGLVDAGGRLLAGPGEAGEASRALAEQGFTTVSWWMEGGWEALRALSDATGSSGFAVAVVAAVPDRLVEEDPEGLRTLGAYSTDRLAIPFAMTRMDGSVRRGDVDTELTYRIPEIESRKGPSNTLGHFQDLAYGVLESGLGWVVVAGGDRSLLVGLQAAEDAIARADGEGLDASRFLVAPSGLSLTTPEAYRRIATLGAQPAFAMSRFDREGASYVDELFGPESEEYAFRLRDAVEAGLAPAIHAGASPQPAEPFRLMAAAVTRSTREGRLLGADQRLTVPEALRAFTTNAAAVLGMEREIGSIEEGKRADFVIVDRNPLEVAVEELPTLAVLETILAGRTTFRR